MKMTLNFWMPMVNLRDGLMSSSFPVFIHHSLLGLLEFFGFIGFIELLGFFELNEFNPTNTINPSNPINPITPEPSPVT
jgi:hypothetical protein